MKWEDAKIGDLLKIEYTNSSGTDITISEVIGFDGEDITLKDIISLSGGALIEIWDVELSDPKRAERFELLEYLGHRPSSLEYLNTKYPEYKL